MPRPYEIRSLVGAGHARPSTRIQSIAANIIEHRGRQLRRRFPARQCRANLRRRHWQGHGLQPVHPGAGRALVLVTWPRYYDKLGFAHHILPPEPALNFREGIRADYKKHFAAHGFHFFDRVDRIALARALLERRRHKPGILLACQLHHCVALRVRRGDLFVRWIRGRDKQHLVKRKSVCGLARDYQMGAMNGIERSSEDSSSHHVRLMEASATVLPRVRFQCRCANSIF
jgi:hypothetical protein